MPKYSVIMDSEDLDTITQKLKQARALSESLSSMVDEIEDEGALSLCRMLFELIDTINETWEKRDIRPINRGH